MPSVSASTLSDAPGRSGDGFGEVVVESHLAFEVGEYGLDDQADAGLLHLRRWALTEAVAVGGDELDAG